MRIIALASGSSGNALLVDSGETRILVDCGIGPRTIAQRIAAAGISPADISAVIITHEHIDHVRGLSTAVAKWPWRVIGSSGTVRGLPPEAKPAAKATRGRVQVGDLDIELIPVSHDANEPTALTITSRTSGIRAGIAHDLGEPSDALIRAFRGVELLCIEANHDAGMLRSGPYPIWLQQRVASSHGHLSNDQTTAFIDAVSTASLETVLLLHLSQVNNSPEVACRATRRGITRKARRASLAAALRKSASEPIGEGPGSQLALAI